MADLVVHLTVASRGLASRMRPVLRGIVVVALVLAALLALIWVSQRRMIYFPTQGVPSAAEAGHGIEEVEYPTDDGLTLKAWMLRPVGEPRGAVLVLNGNAGNRSHRLPLGEALNGAGYLTLLVDYRGYGDNAGSPSEHGLAADARAALAFLRGQREVDQHRIAYFGESLGAGVAVGLARDQAPAALVLRSPFASLPAIAVTHYPLIPVSLLLMDRYDSIGVIGHITAPLLIIAGSEDRIVPVEHSRRLFEAANDPKRIVLVDGAGHNDLALLDGDEMISEVVRFLDEHLARG